MKYWKEHTSLRILLIAAGFLVGLGLILLGWSMTGRLSGLLIMLVGLASLLTALLLYNKPYEDPKEKKFKS